jgi:hypothetical protein
MAYVLLGQHSIADREIMRNPNIWDQLGFQGAIQHLIEMEIVNDPIRVGPPITMVEIAKDGPRWISCGMCSATN